MNFIFISLYLDTCVCYMVSIQYDDLSRRMHIRNVLIWIVSHSHKTRYRGSIPQHYNYWSLNDTCKWNLKPTNEAQTSLKFLQVTMPRRPHGDRGVST